MDDFHSMLMNKTLDLFPSLTEENLEPYLLRSRATSAYDAVTLLAKSVGMAFDQGGDSCTNTSIVQVALDRIFMVGILDINTIYSTCTDYYYTSIVLLYSH